MFESENCPIRIGRIEAEIRIKATQLTRRIVTALHCGSGKQVVKFNVCAMKFIVMFMGIRLFLCLPPFGFLKRGHITMSNDPCLTASTKPNY